ncbi:MAG TPA: bifunctional 4-hydroxy-3-methylbut-2-enyl diphosphate reductase/30S ribosomal protein S1, partial [Pelotomaculum sp.]|nr:bifunctional 4-hydroxy-3-methylbut-2-enyl diphosphate reductase/30S ribosomal protein S1 [Pelotomaculum sp.]
MEVRVASKAGFCYGVKRAIEMSKNTVRNKPGPVFSLGPLIHNPQVVAYLGKLGVREINNLGEIKEGTLIIRSHGVGPALLKAARELGVDIVDATCPFVRRTQVVARDLMTKDYQVVIVGDKNHP